MGRDKALLPLGGTTFALRTARLLLQVCDDALIVGGDPGRFGTTGLLAVADRTPLLGPLGGLRTALESTQRDILAVPCDMPRLRASDLLLLSEHDGSESDAAVFAAGGTYSPLPILLRFAALPRLCDYLASGGRSVRGFLDRLSVSIVRPGPDASDAFESINTPAEYNRLFLK